MDGWVGCRWRVVFLSVFFFCVRGVLRVLGDESVRESGCSVVLGEKGDGVLAVLCYAVHLLYYCTVTYVRTCRFFFA